MTETAATFPNPEIPTINDLDTDRPKTDTEMTYLKKNTNEAIHQNLRKNNVYKSDMHKIYNLIVGQKTNNYKKIRIQMPTYRQSIPTNTQ